MIRNYSLNRMLALCVAAGFLFLLIDSILEHWSIFLQEPMAFTPVVFSAIGLVVGTLAVLQWNDKKIRLLHITLYVSLVVAGAGLYFHIGEDKNKEPTTEQRQHEQKEKEKPLLAPLSFAGIAAIGLLGTSRKWPADVI